MPYYPQKINERFQKPRHAGQISWANGVGTTASFECGSVVRVSVAVENETKTITEAGFQTNGCGYMTASADAAAEYLTGQSLTGLHALNESEFTKLIRSKLGEFPSERLQCVNLVIQAIREALADYRAYILEEFSGEKPLICTCFGVSEETIENFIAVNLPVSVEEVTDACRAGGGCGSCRMLIQEMLDAHES